MKRVLFCTALGVALAAALPLLALRSARESHDRDILLLVDWNEARVLFDRISPASEPLLRALRDLGIRGVLLSPATLAQTVEGGAPALENQTVTWRPGIDARWAFDGLAARGVNGIMSKGRRLQRANGNFAALADTEVGILPGLADEARGQGFSVFARVNADPWLIGDLGLPATVSGVLFSTDELPGGDEAQPNWENRVRRYRWAMLLTEFKPSRAAQRLALALPDHTWRMHTIPSAESRDLRPEQELARWRRAARERSCRVLFIRPRPSDSWAQFASRVEAVRTALVNEGLRPGTRTLDHGLKGPTSWLTARLALAWMVAALAPLAGLAIARTLTGGVAYATIIAVSVAGGLIAAAVAYTPETARQIVPFRGIKLAMLVPWAGSVLLLFSGREWRASLKQPLRRLESVVLLAVLALGGYAIVRSGNAAATWRAGPEQHVRDRLEAALPARPRFKEFALGYPLLLVGCWMAFRRRSERSTDAGRWLVCTGMIGPISTVNTFCHLHSPFLLGVQRSLLGIAFGTGVGLAMIWIGTVLRKKGLRHG